MLLADLGADVIMVERAGPSLMVPRKSDISCRGKRSIILDLKSKDGVEAFLQVARTADAVFEGFRPGVAARLGVGPDDCRAANARLVYAHMTGWGQDGPLAQAAGHDINYLALSGALYSMGRAGEPPAPPLNLVADYGGGAMMMALGIVSAILEAKSSGQGQVIDVSMVEGASLLMSLYHSLDHAGLWNRARDGNFLDGCAPFYDTYKTKDGGFISIGALEPQFYAALCAHLALPMDVFAHQHDRARWDEQKAHLTLLFLTRTRDEWAALLEGTETCFAPVLEFWEAAKHPHNAARGAFIDVAGQQQPAPQPRFSRTKADVSGPGPAPGAHSADILRDAGLSQAQIAALISTDHNK